MDCSVTRATHIFPSIWSGGKTYELFIYPPCSVYSARDFAFRISTATIDTEISEFTKLPGFKRDIMPISGILGLDHKGKYKVKLEFPETDSFMGDWETTSEGKVQDFNLMMSKDALGNIGGFDIENEASHEFIITKLPDFLLFYISEGYLSFSHHHEFFEVGSGDVILFSNFTSAQSIEFKALSKSRLAFAQVNLI